MISSIVLAAGLSERFGSPKAIAQLDKETIFERIQKMLLNSIVEEIIIVLGAHQKELKPFILKHKKVRFVYNKDYNLGQTSSFQEGLRHVSALCQGALLLPVDYPLVQSTTIDQLCNVFLEKTPTILVPCYQRMKGHPPIFHKRIRSELLNLESNSGINTIVRKHKEDELLLEVSDAGVLTTFNTPEEFEKIQDKIK